MAKNAPRWERIPINSLLQLVHKRRLGEPLTEEENAVLSAFDAQGLTFVDSVRLSPWRVGDRIVFRDRHSDGWMKENYYRSANAA